MIDIVLPIVVIIALVAINGLFVAAEFALVGARRTRLEAMANGGSGAARWLIKVFDRDAGKDAYIAIAQLGITLASIGLGMYGEPAVAKWLYPPLEKMGLNYDQSHALGFVIALGAITFLHVVFGEMIPKAMALQAPERVSVSVNAAMRLFGVVFRPMVIVLNKTAFGLMRLLGIPDPDKATMLFSVKELEIAAGESAAAGQIADSQRSLIENIFEMEDRTVEQLMTSRSRMPTLRIEADPEDISRQIATSSQSRYVVYDGTLDRVIGLLHVKDFIRAKVRGEALILAGLIRPLPQVAATHSAADLLDMFRKQRVHAALVVDEAGGTLGMVTMDALVDDLIDEADDASDDWIRRDPDGALQLDGEVTLAELSEDHGIVLDHPDVVTVAGLFFAKLGVVPPIGTQIEVNGAKLIVDKVVGTKITHVKLWPPALSEDSS